MDHERLQACAERLRKLGAPVLAIHGKAKDTAIRARQGAAAYGLNFAFLDPFSIGALDFAIIQTLAQIKRIDILAHVSKMDLQRNLGVNISAENSQFDLFAPGWRSDVDTRQPQQAVRRHVFEHWRKLVAETGIKTSKDTKLITGSRGQHLYWLLLAARHELAHQFWKTSSQGDQGGFDF
jgi:three-Cys-motif partner protein